MNDSPAYLMASLIPLEPANNLFVLDENYTFEEINFLSTQINKYPGNQFLTNRYDIDQQARSLGMNCHFSDFDFSPWPDNCFDNLFFSVSKERAVAHHVINSAGRVLRLGGRLHLAGTKQQGIKTIVKNAGRLLGDSVTSKKHRNTYLASLTKLTLSSEPLDDNQYPEIREITNLNHKPVFSKPGLFGWQKIDQGSAMLAQHLQEVIATFDHKVSLLDLGCGYGYLSIMASYFGAKPIIATDNNAAAILSCKKNFHEHHIEGQVLADDCAHHNNERFDLVISHPPFHKGFELSENLGEQFIQAAQRHLKTRGKALFVANSFVPLETIAKRYFRKIEQVKNDQHFKLVLMQGRRHVQ